MTTMFDSMDFQTITLRYYSHWLGQANSLADSQADILTTQTPRLVFLPSTERNRTQPGYSRPFDLYAWVEPDRLIVSYGEKAAPQLPLLQKQLADAISLPTVAHTCCGVFIADTLVSCTDAPCMPYRQEETQEIGINTLSDHRGKGYAVHASILCAENSIQSGKCPLWSCAAHNIPSCRLAEKVGFRKLSDVLTLTL